MPGKQALAAFARQSKKNYGPRSSGNAAKVGLIPRVIPLGPIRLDHALGGGLHIGGVHSFYGEKSGGKTTTSMIAVAKCQKLCRNCYRVASDIEAVPPSDEVLKEDPNARWGAKGKCTCFAEGIYEPAEIPSFTDDNGKKLAENSGKYKAALEAWSNALKENSYEEFVCAWIDLELSFDGKYAAVHGVDARRVQLFRPESAEVGIDILHAMSCTVEVDLIVTDSIAQMAPNKEIESSAEEWQQGLQARLVNKMSRLLIRDSSMVTNQGRSVTHIWINQTRQKIGVMYGDPTTKPGGKGQEFAVHAELRFKNAKREVEEQLFGAKDKGEHVDIPLSETFFFENTKNKKGSTKGVGGHYTVRLRASDAGPVGSLIEEDEVFKMAMHFLVKQDAKTKKYKLGDAEFDTQKELLGRFREDAAFMNATKTVLLEHFLAGGS